MPLHDWSALSGWDGVHQVWIVELLYFIQPRLPSGYRAYIGTTPAFAIGAPSKKRPDVGVRNWLTDVPPPPSQDLPATSADTGEEPDQEIALATLEGQSALFVAHDDRLIAAVELVSPRNKDRQSACATYTNIYAGYLLKGVNLLLVDVHRRPLQFSFAEGIAAELRMEQIACPAPFALSYRVGEEAPGGGRFLAVWRRPLTVGGPLPSLKLALSVKEFVLVDLEATYSRAAAAAYLST